MKKRITPPISIIKALTPYSWKRTPIRTAERKDKIFQPCDHVSLDPIPGMMNHHIKYVQNTNPYCNVYVSIPAVKDLYKFNQTHIIRAWRNEYKDVLKKTLSIEPKK